MHNTYIAGLILLILTGCGAEDTGGDQQQLDTNRALWLSKGITDYRFTYQESCFCSPEEKIQIIVKDRLLDSAVYSPSNVPVTNERLQDVKTLPEYFAVIQSAIDDDALSVVVDYDADYGFATRISIDPDESMIDGGVVYTLGEFDVPASVMSSIDQAQCEAVEICGSTARLDCGSNVDGPLYYFNLQSEGIISTCGGACFAPDAQQQVVCDTMCPPAQWTCT
jgi:hypothetical protein